MGVSDNSVLQSLWQQFTSHFPVSTLLSWSIKKWCSQFGVGELDCPAQSPDIDPHPTPFRMNWKDGFEPGLTSVVNLRDFVAEWEKI